MSVVAAPSFVPRKFRLAHLAMLLLLFLGLLSFAAVHEASVECQPVYLTNDEGTAILTNERTGEGLTTGERRCHVVVGDARVPLPAPLATIF